MHLPDQPPLLPPAHPTLGVAFRYWLKLGFISFGGPAGHISMMHTELVERRRWISEQRFLHALNYCMLLPGPEAIQLAIYIGWLLHGIGGAVVAGILYFLPSFFILCGLSYIYLVYGDLPAVAAILWGIKPAVVAIVVFAAWRIGSRALQNGLLWGLAAAAFVAFLVFGVPFPAVVAAAGLIGAVGGRFAPEWFRTGGGQGSSNKRFGPALIDDDSPPPPHARFRWSRVAAISGVGLLIWLTAMVLLVLLYGWDGTLTRMGWFFTKAAMLTFGGAYAVLPYVYDAAVNHYGWLSGPQMIDGLALGETTPGPLIMIVTYVGFLGGWLKGIFGGDALLWGATAGAAVATFFTFLPSFLFILIGGPLVEATRGELRLTAPLTAITAAVVGVVLNLAVFFAWHAFWPHATTADLFSGAFDWPSLLLASLAAVALFRYKMDILLVIGVSALIGLATMWMHTG